MSQALRGKLDHKFTQHHFLSRDGLEPHPVSAVCQTFQKECLNMVIQSMLVQSGDPCTKHLSSLSGSTVGDSLAPGIIRWKESKAFLDKASAARFECQECVCIPVIHFTLLRRTGTSSDAWPFPPCSSLS